MARKVSEVNASSVADIAFLLLIFFLVATTMDVDSGLSRKLPPMPEPGAQEDDKQIKERNVFVVLINANDQLMVEGKPMDVHNLRKEAKEFIVNPSNKEELPEKSLREIDYFGEVMAPKGIISLMNDRGTSYGIYIKVQNELIAAYNEVRDETAMREFGKHYEKLPEDKQDAVKEYYPQIISEAEPKNIGGN
ncbi:MAG: biopolymer transporter ExbD [Bacteroidales bacterium]|jgi:biopolymer transport protein ExbD|nr:biopolymer transporter ExbD [Bacteroidales bacterium]